MWVFIGLIMLDIIQGIVGVVSLIFDVLILYEEVVLINIVFMELVYVKSYSQIFFMLCFIVEIDDVFCWLEENCNLQCKVEIVLQYYCGDELFKCKVVFILLESFLFYFGFYLLMYWLSWVKLINIVDMIWLIICDEVVYGYYIGYKFQCGLVLVDDVMCVEFKDYIYELLFEFYDNEVEYIQDFYDEVGLIEDVKKFLCYNVNKVLMNFGYEVLFFCDEIDVNLVILLVLLFNVDENYDFFFGFGLSYVIGKVVVIEDDDWDFQSCGKMGYCLVGF